MKAALYYGPNDIRCEEVPDPVLAEGDVLLRIKACGICGSDLHTYKQGQFEDLGVPVGNGRIMGHEFAGEVVEVKGGSPDLKPGDRVFCVSTGANAELLGIPKERTPIMLPIPEGTSFEEAATIEPLATSLHAVNLATPQDGEIHVVMGTGIIGLGIIQVLKATSNVKIVAVDISDLRLDVAKEVGADITLNASQESTVDKLFSLFGTAEISFMPGANGMIDTIYDCAGLPMGFEGSSVLEQALTLTKENGKVVLVAIYEKAPTIEHNLIVRKGLSIFGSWAWNLDELAESHQLICSGKIDRKPLISHRFPLEQAKEAYDTQFQAKEAIKVMITP